MAALLDNTIDEPFPGYPNGWNPPTGDSGFETMSKIWYDGVIDPDHAGTIPW
jgi:hypothetical protein